MPIRLESPIRYDPDQQSRQHPIQRAVRTRAGLTFISAIVVWLLAFACCSHYFWRDPESTFFRSGSVYKFGYTSHRLEEARQLIESAEVDSNLTQHVGPPDAVICIGIITIKRKGIQYFNDTLGSLLAGLTDEERSAVNVQVLFADPVPSKHPSYEQNWLKLLDAWSGYNISDSQLDEILEWQRDEEIRAKAIFDYTYMLDQCLNTTSAPYIAVFEDDIILADGWLSKTMAALRAIRPKPAPWLYLRLFYTEIMTGWDKGIDPWYTNPIFLLISSLSLAFSTAIGLRIHTKRTHPNKDQAALTILTFLAIPSLILLVWMVGRNSLFPHSGLERMDTKGCCTQALVFPRTQISALTTMLRNQEPDQTDLLIEEWATEQGLARYALTPQLAQHVGLVSTRGVRRKASQKTWAFYHEASDPARLKREHEELAQWAIWRAFDDYYPSPTKRKGPR